MRIVEELRRRNENRSEPFLIGPAGCLSFSDVEESMRQEVEGIGEIRAGDVVAIVGDFDRFSVSMLLRLLDSGAIVMPLTTNTEADHEYFFESGRVDFVIDQSGGFLRRRQADRGHPLLEELRRRGHPGLIAFSSGTTGRPKAILHDFETFLARFKVPRTALRTLSFLLFDHVGGLNTVFHTMFNKGVVIVPTDRTPEAVASDLQRHDVELLPTTPTFLRMMLLAGAFDLDLPSLRVITYGTEKMDQGTLDRLAAKLPSVDLRQTYGLSELGVFQAKSKARDSLWMKIGGPGIEWRVVNGVLEIKSENRMLGYLNAPSPFVDGWYDTGDVVEQDGEYIKVVGRAKEWLNVGGMKILPSEIERVALLNPDVLRAKAYGVDNPITGQHIEVICEPRPGATLDRRAMGVHFRNHLQKRLSPHRVIIGEVGISHRFKQK